MDQRRALVIIGTIIVVLLAVVFGTAFLSRNNRFTRNNAVRNSSPSPLLPTQSTASPSPATDANLQIFTGDTFSLGYPQNWGLLTCNNSKHFEFDPATNQDQLNIACDRAVKPITVLVGDKFTCEGEVTKFGNVLAVKSKTTEEDGDIRYRWCLDGPQVDLDITHRVSTEEKRGFFQTDY